ncbi:hypothetical protein LCGC14_0121670 [marine sediment metagenome]|uniref:DUF2911 domain-containing protein n=1 Tax=marine sediment metagenome TaxID=412755 RepID=A0A0F9V6C0_9ZZZZ|nr:DUF2911 domain-containing protein [Maribacter sp.]HDZ05988.1 DUF2911 domain-containing protein [Maribacter sp.]HEA80726.1 DUF2911 domain-containing protein [Maribacter sp.]
MRNIFAVIVIFSLFTTIGLAQDFRGLDKSPLDRVYLPDHFAHDIKFAPERNLPDSPVLKIDYSRPQKNEREVFGGMVKYNEIWRLGANESTEIKVYKDVKIDGKLLKEGTYSMYAIPTEKQWTIIFNTDIDHWGHYSYDENNDVLRVEAHVLPNKKSVEEFSIQFEDVEEGIAVMYIAWDLVRVELPISY